MGLKTVIADPAEVPDALREHYKQTTDGKFALVLDGDQPPGFVKADKLAEFRSNNRKLHAANVELEAKLKVYDGIDPDAARAALAELADTEIVDSDDLDKAHSAELAAVQSEKAKQVEELQAQLAAEVNAHNTTRFNQTVAYEFVRAGGRESAVDFIVGKAAEVFTMKDGKLTTKEFSTARPGEPLSISEWVAQQSHTCDFAFRPSKGGGALQSHAAPARRTVSSDPLEFGRNLSDIASGDVTVL